MTAQLHLLDGKTLTVDASAAAAVDLLRSASGGHYAEFRAHEKAVFVNAAAVAYVDEPGEPRVTTLN